MFEYKKINECCNVVKDVDLEAMPTSILLKNVKKTGLDTS